MDHNDLKYIEFTHGNLSRPISTISKLKSVRGLGM
jgi:hypothetical protein